LKNKLRLSIARRLVPQKSILCATAAITSDIQTFIISARMNLRFGNAITLRFLSKRCLNHTV